MAKKKKNRGQEEPRELTRKEEHLSARDRERNRKVTLAVAVIIGLVVVILLIGLVNEFVLKPNSAVATVDGDKIATKDYWKRLYLEENQLENQYLQFQQLQQQFGSQDLFTSQLTQIQATLSSPFNLGIDVLDKMIEEQLIADEAAARGITVSDEEVEEALRAEVAGGQRAVTEPQATSTAEAAAEATEIAAAWTPTPTPTIDASRPLTATDPVVPTPEPQPTLPLLTDAAYQEGLDTLATNLDGIGGMNLDEYRQLIYARLLSEKLAAEIGEERTETTAEEVHARHILIREIAPPPPTEGEAETEAGADTADASAETGEEEAETRTLAEADALTAELAQRIEDGEDFADLAAEYSDDLSNAASGGDLGWFGRGSMVVPFEEAAFALAVGEVSQPVETQFGYHLIEVLEKDDARPKDESTLEQEQFQAYQEFLQEQMASADIERAEDLTSKLPDDVATGAIFSASLPQAPQVPVEESP